MTIAADQIHAGEHAPEMAPTAAVLRTLLNLHTAKRKLLLAMDRRKRLGQCADDLEHELALARREARQLLAALGKASEADEPVSAPAVSTRRERSR